MQSSTRASAEGGQVVLFQSVKEFAVRFIVLPFAFLGMTAWAQPIVSPKAWMHIAAPPPDKAIASRWVQPVRGEFFRLDRAVLQRALLMAKRGEPADARRAGTEVEIPMPDGTTARFAIVEAPVMAPELAAKFPEIRTYAGQGIDDPTATIRLDLSPTGFRAQVLSPRGAVYVDPAYRGDAEHHISYYKRDYRNAFASFECQVRSRGMGAGSTVGTNDIRAAKVQSGPTLRTYRLAVACTGEYAAFFGGTKTNAMNAIVAAVNRVNGVYETELAVRMVLVGNNDLLVYTNAASDPYANDDGGVMLEQNQTNIDAVIGSGNYDIGHVFSTGGGGIASLGCVCVPDFKAQGVTGSSSPTGDAFWIDYVAHEMGHQFGANHTFNSETGSCGGGNREPSTAFEPGSGSTIMAYAGICSPNDLQPHSDPYFHAGSLDEIQTFLSTGEGGNCAVNSSTGNGAPSVNAGPDYVIPASTPFILTASGSDPNSDPLTYCWEEMDAGSASSLADLDNGSGPLFRSFNPSNSPIRHLPKLSSVLANTNWNQEKLPTLSRTMKFRVTARDNRAGGGGVADDDMEVTVVGTAGPFVVTAPNTAVIWSGTRTVTWNVAGTAASPINASGVNIALSTNGGLTFPFLLATNVANNGSAVVVLPELNTTQARIRVQGAGNIFYDVSDANFSIVSGPLVQLQGTTLTAESCSPTNGAVDPYETVTVNWSLFNAGSAPTTNLVATLLATNGVYYPSPPQSYGAIPAGGSVTRAFSFTPAGLCGGSVTGVVQLTDGALSLGTLAQTFRLGKDLSVVSTQVFSAGAIIVPDYAVASPYPSKINVSGVTNSIIDFSATLAGVTHPYSYDIDALLVGPGGQKVALMTYAGDGSLSNVTLTFADTAADYLPFDTQIFSGTYLPSDYELLALGSFDFPSPAPARPYGASLSPLLNSPNGSWSLYVYDTESGGAGSIAGGWSLRFVTSNSVFSCCTTTNYPAPSFTSTTYSSNTVRLRWSTLPGPYYQVEYRTNLSVGAWQSLGAALPGTGTFLNLNDAVTNGPTRFYRVRVSPSP